MTKRKPTLSQLRKRPSLWVSGDDNLRFVYPSGRMEKIYELRWMTFHDWHKDLLAGEHYEFVAWL